MSTTTAKGSGSTDNDGGAVLSGGTTTVLTQVAANSTVGFEIKKTGSTTQHWKIVDGQTVNGTLEFYDATDSATRMAINGNGNVGIGTAAPALPLQVSDTGFGQLRLTRDATDDRHWDFLVATSGYLAIKPNNSSGTSSEYITIRDGSNTEKIRLATADDSFFVGGNVGIGDSSPSEKLCVNDSAHDLQMRIGSLTAGRDARIRLQGKNSANSANRFADIGLDAENGLLQFWTPKTSTPSAVAVSIDSSGALGVGLSAPTKKLTIYDTTPVKMALQNNSSGTGASDGLEFYLSGLNAGIHNYENGAINFATNNSNRLIIASDGTVSVNRSVNGGLGPTLILVNDPGSSTAAATESRLAFAPHHSGTETASIRGIAENTGAQTKLSFYTHNGSALAEKMVITADGNVGIGTNNPSAAYGPVLHVRGTNPVLRLDGTGANSWAWITMNTATASEGRAMGLGADGSFRVTANSASMDANIQLHITQAGAVTFNSAFTFPTTDGSAGQVLQTNGSGTVTWATVSGGGGVSGSGTDHYIPRWNGTTALQDSSIIALDSGSVGIGVAAPAHKLQVNGTVSIRPNGSSNNQHYFTTGGANNASYSMYDSGGTIVNRFRTDSTSYINGGSFGVGTASPSRRLTVQGSSGDNLPVRIIAGASTTTCSLEFQDPNTTADYKVTMGSVGDNMFFQAGGSERVRIKSDGNVGIGTNAPVKKLDVRAAASWDGIHIGSTAGSATAIDFARSTTNANPTARIGVAEPGATHTSDMRFFTSDASGGAPNLVEKMRINPDGNVGIGTNAPLDKLDVYGTGAIFRNLSDDADSVQIVRGTNHTASPDAKFYIYDNSSADWAAKINLDGASYGLDITGGVNYFLLCRDASGNRMFEVHNTSVVINDGSTDMDFRVEGNGDDYLLFTDGGNDRVAVSTNSPAAKLHVEGDFKVGASNNGNWMGYKDVAMNGSSYTTALTINLANHTACHVKLFLSGDWSSHSAVAFVGEYFIQNSADGYQEPGQIISEFDNTNTDLIMSKIVDPSSDTFTIQLKLSSTANGSFTGKLTYHVMGMATAVS